MQSTARRLAALLALPLILLAGGAAWSAPAAEHPAPPVPAATAPDSPVQVTVGAFINDIQQLDFKTNNYAVDLYVWFRWKAPDLDPSKTMEFMNRYASDDNVREELYAKSQAMPDGSLYAIVRYQGRFSTKFQLDTYPFDTQVLTVVMEDTISAADKQVHAPDPEGGSPNSNPPLRRRARGDHSSPRKCIASQTVGGSPRVQFTRWRQWAGSNSQSPCVSARSSASPSSLSRAAPATSSTNSSLSWSYHCPSGVAWPKDTIRSMRKPARLSRTSVTSSGRGAGGRPPRRLPALSIDRG